MKVLLCGGGTGMQCDETYIQYAGLIDKNKPVLYLPFAMEESEFANCYNWITAELKPYGIHKIERLPDLRELKDYNLSKYSSLFFGGGNTFLLLKLLKDTGAFEIINNYIKNNGIVFGSSAGAIIFSKDIMCTAYADPNDVKLTDTKGFDCLNGFDLCCHYSNLDDEQSNYERKAIAEYAAKGNKVIALPEEDSLYVEHDRATLIGSKNCKLFGANVPALSPKAVYLL